MFRKFLIGTGAESDADFSVRLKGLHTIEYREGVRRLEAFREMLIGDPSMDIDSSSIESWLHPYEDEVITPEKKKQILKNICDAIEFLKLTYIVR